MASPEPPRAIDRTTLVHTVADLSSGDLALVVALIEGAARHISRHGTIPEQAAELIRWAESPAGPALEAIQRALEQLSPGPTGKEHKAPAGPIPIPLGLVASVIGAAAVLGLLAYLAPAWWGPPNKVSPIPNGSPAAAPKESGSNETSDNRKVALSESNPKGRSDTAVLEGFVKDAETGRFLEGVELALNDYDDAHGKTPTCRTDPEGRFRFRDLPASAQPVQRVRLTAWKEGYQLSDTYTSLGTTALPVILKSVTPRKHHQ
jgi:hypothetical protein